MQRHAYRFWRTLIIAFGLCTAEAWAREPPPKARQRRLSNPPSGSHSTGLEAWTT